jgi:hypothetical protein
MCVLVIWRRVETCFVTPGHKSQDTRTHRQNRFDGGVRYLPECSFSLPTTSIGAQASFFLLQFYPSQTKILEGRIKPFRMRFLRPAVGNSSHFFDNLHFEHFDKRVNLDSWMTRLSKCSKWRLSKDRGLVADGCASMIMCLSRSLESSPRNPRIPIDRICL